MHKMILLVEDNASDEKLTVLAFKKSGITNAIVVERDGAAALDYLFGTGLHEGRDTSMMPAIVLLDLKLPKVDGLDVLRRIRADVRTKLVPVVVLTSSKEEEDVVASYSLGANAYVRKPVEFSEFADAARTLGLFWLLLKRAFADASRWPMTATLRVLMVEDSPTDAKLVAHAIRSADRAIEVERVENEVDMRAALARSVWDVVISDFSMPKFTAIRALEVLHEANLDLPFILVSGTIGEDFAVQAMRAGAHDYVLKDKLARLPVAIDRELRQCAERRARREADEALRKSEARYRGIIESSHQGVWMLDAEGRTSFMSSRMAAMLGISASAALGRSMLDFADTGGRAALLDHLDHHCQGLTHRSEARFERADGQPLHTLIESHPIGEGTYEGSFMMIMDVTARKAADDARRRAEDALAESEAEYRVIFESSPLPKWLYDVETRAFLAVNDAAVSLYGYSRAEFLEATIDVLCPPSATPHGGDPHDGDEMGCLGRDTAGSPKTHRLFHHAKKDGTTIEVDVYAHTFSHRNRQRRLVVVQDVTERRLLEEQLRQAQKMDAVGRLAGGVAHDFNNNLSVILSYSEIILDGLPQDDPTREDLCEIQEAGRRAADLTRQLLMFSRQQVLEPAILDLNEVIRSTNKMLERLLGADIKLVIAPGDRLRTVRADRGSMEQIVMNLVVNARDAMPTGGKLTMTTANVVLDEAYARAHLGAKAGPHVMLSVSDDGIGMNAATKARIFEPFFTTKEPTKGTGLGLSTVFGIVQQDNGSIAVESEAGKGTTFRIFLPVADEALDVARRIVSEGPAGRGSETILLVEDDDRVRAVARDILEKQSYIVIDASNAADALRLVDARADGIDLLLTDVVMPEMSGPELAIRLSAKRPDVKVLCMSGYSDDSAIRYGLFASIAYLQKPFTPESLARKVREVLDAPGRVPPSVRGESRAEV